MSAKGKRMVAVIGLVFLAMTGTPAAASAGEATLYQLTENMTLDNLKEPRIRTASAALQGTADLGTPLCPAALAILLGRLQLPGGASCTITVFGQDEISLETGRGMTGGRFAVVVNADNPVDTSELVVMRGEFSAHVQVLVDATGRMLPLIRILDGTVTPTHVLGVEVDKIDEVADIDLVFQGLTPEMFPAAPFGGVFRLPFAVSKGKRVPPQRNRDAFYLGDGGQLIKVRKDELSLGYPTVRVEIGFEIADDS